MVDLSIGFHGGSFQFANRKRLPGRVFATEGPFLIPTPPWLDHRPTQPWSMLRIKHEYWSLWTIYGCIYICYTYIYDIYIYHIYIYIYIYHTTVISYKLLSIHQYGWLTIIYWTQRWEPHSPEAKPGPRRSCATSCSPSRSRGGADRPRSKDWTSKALGVSN